MDIMQFHKQATLIGACLKDFKYDQRSSQSDWAVLIHKSGGLICLKQDWRKLDKAKARVAYRSNAHFGFTLISGEIGFSLNRKPQAISKDITNRLLPTALEEWTRQKNKEQREKTKAEAFKFKSNNLKVFMPELEKLSYCHSDIARYTGDSYSYEKDKLRLLVHTSPVEDGLNLQVTNIPEDLAYQILFLIKSHGAL